MLMLFDCHSCCSSPLNSLPPLWGGTLAVFYASIAYNLISLEARLANEQHMWQHQIKKQWGRDSHLFADPAKDAKWQWLKAETRLEALLYIISDIFCTRLHLSQMERTFTMQPLTTISFSPSLSARPWPIISDTYTHLFGRTPPIVWSTHFMCLLSCCPACLKTWFCFCFESKT